MNNNGISEFRKDLVSGDWILFAPGRKKRPGLNVKIKKKERSIPSSENCPFENPEPAILWEPLPGKKKPEDWLVKIKSNKYPALVPHKICPKEEKNGIYSTVGGVGFHEVIVTRFHQKTIAEMSAEEVEVLIRTYQKRYRQLKNEPCIQYILIFHNFGEGAGASIFHPHSQIIALPIIPLDVRRSFDGSRKYFEENKKCVHCDMIKSDLKEKARIVYENKDFVVLCPFASQISFEIRIYPKKHQPYFEEILDNERFSLAEALKTALQKLKKRADDPDYNFFIHTSPPADGEYKYYHWHLEILPRISRWAGLELGSGTNVVAVLPEEAAAILKKSKIKY